MDEDTALKAAAGKTVVSSILTASALRLSDRTARLLPAKQPYAGSNPASDLQKVNL